MMFKLCNFYWIIIPNFAVCEHACYQWIQYFRNKQKFFILVLLLRCFDTQVHWCTNNNDWALYTSTHRQHPLQGGEPHLLQRPLLRLLLICKITISYLLKLCLHALKTYFNSYGSTFCYRHIYCTWPSACIVLLPTISGYMKHTCTRVVQKVRGHI